MASSHRQGKTWKKQVGAAERREIGVMMRVDPPPYTQENNDPITAELAEAFTEMDIDEVSRELTKLEKAVLDDPRTNRLVRAWVRGRDTTKLYEMDKLPYVGEHWMRIGREDGHSVWKCRDHDKPNFHNLHREHGVFKHQVQDECQVHYRDDRRIVFKSVHTRDHITCHIECLPTNQFDDVAEPGSIWEIENEQNDTRIWRRVAYPPFPESWDLVRDSYDENDDLEEDTPYRFCGSNRDGRIWVDQITQDITIEKRKRELCAAGESKQFFLSMTLSGQEMKVMVDSGAQGCFMNVDYCRDFGIPTMPKRRPYQIAAIDGKDVGIDGWVRKETAPLEVVSNGNHAELIVFDIMPIGSHAIILGADWIRKHNPEIDWSTDTFSFSRCSCTLPAW